ncbi:D-alanyl-D-alanine carboxypeptidase family protein [Fonticella tunisiensis]|uniref:serine-type D-Ala-D-Ala carboxypeptidase n=1 Tax=Fonticella tunisiensis TaxID=1096341 RepID=A0A4R7KSH1_9CLOT|nr:D-alanyl-D-alanine carboxypeptidase family protein [Fonticella tunisiensis]TDT61918.1 D-alanyl-D-alanine carboxypeptidase (penicillin-binding protein 5/6) [Fonticella tunisiensis]
MKRYLSLIMVVLLLIVSPVRVSAKAADENLTPETFNIKAKSALLMEYDSGKIIFEYNSHDKLAPASVTKIMTMLLAMEAVDSGKVKLSDKVTVSERAKSMGGSTMFLETGEIRTLEELIKGVAIESANDAAVAIAEFLGGTEEEFVKMMNKRARELGMKDTNFVNSMGFHDPNHYTSAHDVAIMSRELLKHRKILDYTTIWMETISEGRKSPFTLTNRNKMIKRYSGCDGLKTGYTSEAKYCISATAKRGNIRFIAVIMGADSWKDRNAQAERLMDYGFAKYESVNVIKKGEVIQEIKMPKSIPEKVNLIAKEDLNVVFEKGTKAQISKKIDIKENVKLPLKKGDVVGSIKAIEGDKIYGEIPLVIDCDVNRMTFPDALKKAFKSWLGIQ